MLNKWSFNNNIFKAYDFLKTLEEYKGATSFNCSVENGYKEEDGYHETKLNIVVIVAFGNEKRLVNIGGWKLWGSDKVHFYIISDQVAE